MTLIPAIRWLQTFKTETIWATFINNSAMKGHLGWFNEALNIMLLVLLVLCPIYTNVCIQYWVINYLKSKLDCYLESINFKQMSSNVCIVN